MTQYKYTIGSDNVRLLPLFKLSYKIYFGPDPPPKRLCARYELSQINKIVLRNKDFGIQTDFDTFSKGGPVDSVAIGGKHVSHRRCKMFYFSQKRNNHVISAIMYKIRVMSGLIGPYREYSGGII